MKKKVLSLILSFALCLSVMPEPVYTKAAGSSAETGSSETGSSTETGSSAGNSAGSGSEAGNGNEETETAVSGNAAEQNTKAGGCRS